MKMLSNAKQKNQRYFSRYTETKEDTKKRLENIKEIKKDVHDLKEEIHFKTGNEFSYKMHSIQIKGDKLLSLQKTNSIMLNKSKIIQINFEIERINKKLKKMMPIYKQQKIKFGKNGTFKQIQQKQDLKSNKRKYLSYKEYIKKLEKAKMKLENRIND